MQMCKLAVLPESLLQLTALKNLFLDKNQLVELPDLGALSSLKASRKPPAALLLPPKLTAHYLSTGSWSIDGAGAVDDHDRGPPGCRVVGRLVEVEEERFQHLRRRIEGSAVLDVGLYDSRREHEVAVSARLRFCAQHEGRDGRHR